MARVLSIYHMVHSKVSHTHHHLTHNIEMDMDHMDHKAHRDHKDSYHLDKGILQLDRSQ